MESMTAETWGAVFLAVFVLNSVFLAWLSVWRGNRISRGKIHGIGIEEMHFHRAGVARGAFLQHQRWATGSMRRKAFFIRWLFLFPKTIASTVFSRRIWVVCGPQFVLLGVALLISTR